MKKFTFVSAAVPLCIAVLGGCTASESVPEIQAAADCDAAVVYRDTEYRCHIHYVNRNTAAVTVLSPPDISGLTFTRSGGEYSCSLGSLLCRNNAVNKGSLADEVFGVFDLLAGAQPESVKKTGDDRYEFRYSNMLLTADGSGHPLKADNGKILIDTSSEQ